MTSIGQQMYNYGISIPNDPRGLQQAALAVWRHDYAAYVRSLLYYRFDDQTASLYVGFLNPVQNPLRRIARLLAVTYVVPCYRTSKSDQVDQVLYKYAPDIDTALGEGEAGKHAWGDAFIVPYWDDVMKRVRFHIYAPTEWDVGYNADGSVNYYEHLDKVRYYTDGTISRVASSGPFGGAQEWGPREQLFRVCPVAWFRLNPYSDISWSINNVRDLIVGTIEIGLSECLNNLGEYYRSFRQPYLSGPSDGTAPKRAAAGMRMGPDTVLEKQIETAELADPTNPYYENIRKKISDLAATRGISDSVYFSQAKNIDSSAVFTPEIRKIWRDNVKYQAEPERQLLRAVVAIIAKYTKEIKDVESDREWFVDYREPNPEDSDSFRALEILDQGVRLGVDSQVDYLMRTNRELTTRALAEAKLKQNATDRAMVVELMRELNAPEEPGDEGKTPQENGRDGGNISAEMRGEYNGKSGPSATPEDL